MNSPCLSPPYRSEAFAEDLEPPAPPVNLSRHRLGLVLLAVVPVILALASGAATVLVRWS